MNQTPSLYYEYNRIGGGDAYTTVTQSIRGVAASRRNNG